MASTLTLHMRGDEGIAQRIIDEFGERTGLRSETTADGAIFEIEGEEHEIEIVETLDEIDPSWPDHLALEQPA